MMHDKIGFQNEKRNYGIDLFRIISMFMIPLLHILGHGGILGNSITMPTHNKLAWLLEIAAFCAVDSYGLISGYVGYGNKHRYSKLIYLYFQVVFYTIGTTMLFWVCKPEVVGMKTIIKAVFPFAYSSTYWYFSSYFCLFFFMPFYNLLLERFEKTTMKKILFSAFLIFSILPTLFHSDFGLSGDGYSFLWLSILYLLGGYIRKYGSFLLGLGVKNILGYGVCVLITWFSKICIECITVRFLNQAKGGCYLISYTSPTIVFCSLFLLLFFSDLKCGKKLSRFIRFFAPMSFGVYVFHEEPLVRDTFINGAFVGYLSFNPILMVFAVIGTAFGIWLIGSLVDGIRLKIFDILKIKRFCVYLEEKVTSFLYAVGGIFV